MGARAVSKPFLTDTNGRRLKTRDGKAVYVGVNVYGNWYGYLAGREVQMFFGRDAEQEADARRWLQEQVQNDAAIIVRD